MAIAKIRRKRLHVRQSLGCPGLWHVGYWGNNTHREPDRDFRSFGQRSSREDAVQLAREIVQAKPYLYLFGS